MSAGTHEEDAATLTRGFDAEPEREVSFARTDRPGEDHVARVCDPLSAG